MYVLRYHSLPLRGSILQFFFHVCTSDSSPKVPQNARAALAVITWGEGTVGDWSNTK
jgi:hypothetical protein